MNRFIFDWVLVNNLAIGSIPESDKDLNTLVKLGIKSVLNLCCEDEGNISNIQKNKNLSIVRYTLPDHKADYDLRKENVYQALEILNSLFKNGPVFVHCYASVERSPLICIAWLMLNKSMSFINALDYLKEVHIQTNPLDKQLAVLREIEAEKNLK